MEKDKCIYSYEKVTSVFSVLIFLLMYNLLCTLLNIASKEYKMSQFSHFPDVSA